jgi:DNA-binding response OmpR family regulator
VDDDPGTRRVVHATLSAEAFEVATAGSAEEALRWIENHGLPDLAVVDVMLPGMSGLDLCAHLQSSVDIPTVLLTVISDETTMVSALDQYAEDYIVKPIRPAELAARVRRVLRRLSGGRPMASLPVDLGGGVQVDLGRQQLRRGAEQIPLTPTENKLLHVLLRSSPRVVASSFLLRRLWPLEEVYEDTLRVHVHRLRQKIEPDPNRPRILLTQRGLGYRLAPPSEFDVQ